MSLLPPKIKDKDMHMIAWAAGGVSLLVAAAVFIGSTQLPVFKATSQTAATALGDTQGVPAGYTGQTYPMPTSCYNYQASSPVRNRGNLPSCSSYNTVAVFSAHLQGVNSGRTGVVYGSSPSYVGSAVDGKPGDPVSIEWSCQPSVAVTYTYCQFSSSGACNNSKEGWYTNYYASNSVGTGFSTGGALVGSKVVPFPATNTTYTLQCGAQTPLSILVGKIPTLTISASPQSIQYGTSTTVTWSTTNAPAGATCTVTGTGVSATGISGSKVTPALTANTTYTMNCVSGFGTQTASTVVTVGPRPVAVLSLTATPTTVVSGNKTTIAWSAQNVNSCTVSGPTVFANTMSGSKLTGNLTTNSTYTLTCTTGDPAAPSKSTTLTVPVTAAVCTSVPGTPGVCSFSAVPANVLQGGPSTITWNCPNVNNSSSSGTNFSTGGALTGTKVVNPLTTTTYSLLCNPSGGRGTATVTVAQPVLTIIAAPQRVRKGKTSSIQWTAANVTAGSCQVTASNAGVFSAGDNGSKLATMSQPTIFTLGCTTPAGSISTSVKVDLLPEFTEQ